MSPDISTPSQWHSAHTFSSTPDITASWCSERSRTYAQNTYTDNVTILVKCVRFMIGSSGASMTVAARCRSTRSSRLSKSINAQPQGRRAPEVINTQPVETPSVRSTPVAVTSSRSAGPGSYHLPGTSAAHVLPLPEAQLASEACPTSLGNMCQCLTSAGMLYGATVTPRGDLFCAVSGEHSVQVGGGNDQASAWEASTRIDFHNCHSEKSQKEGLNFRSHSACLAGDSRVGSAAAATAAELETHEQLNTRKERPATGFENTRALTTSDMHSPACGCLTSMCNVCHARAHSGGQLGSERAEAFGEKFRPSEHLLRYLKHARISPNRWKQCVGNLILRRCFMIHVLVYALYGYHGSSARRA